MNELIELELGNQRIKVYTAKPKTTTKGGLIVIHEVWGLTDHIKKVADRFAAEGYFVVAPDFMSSIDLPEELVAKLQLDLFDPKKRSEAQPKLRQLMAPIQTPAFAQSTLDSLKGAFSYLYGQKEVNKKVAVVGYCFGGSYSFSLAVNEPRLIAAIPFYGHADFSIDELKQIKCPILAFYGENDERLMLALPKLKADMKTADVDFSAKVYPDCGHAFFNDSNGYAYNASAAADAWKLSLNFLSDNFNSAITKES